MKILVEGCGSIGSRHAANLLELGHEVWINDLDVSKLGWLESKGAHVFDGGHWSDIEAIVIATPSPLHIPHMERWLERGKHVLVEKPIALGSPNSVERCIKLANDNGLVLKVGYMCRFTDVVRMAKTYLSEGEIGNPIFATFVCAQYNDRPDYLRNGVLYNWSHEIDTAIHLLGSASMARRCAIVTGNQTTFMLNQGTCKTAIHLNYVTRPESRGFYIVGETGYIKGDLVHHILDVNYQREWSFAGFPVSYKKEVKDFIAAIEGLPSIGCTGQEALDVLTLCLDAEAGEGWPL